jgi:glycosyltransferase involved in cell wall biosynthesis
MTISVIIPVYNVEKCIKRCLDSVIAQESDDFDIECILVDDCSPDMSMDIAKGIIAQYNGSIIFRLLQNQENQGLSCSRNNGLMIAKGDYVFFLDSDDDLAPNCLSSLYKEINQNGRDVDMVIGNSYDYYSGNYWQKKDGTPSLLLNHDDIMRRFLRVEIPPMAWNKLVRRQFLLDNQLYFRPRMLHEDELWSYQLFNVIRSVVLIPEVTYHYEQNEFSIMNSSTSLIPRTEGCHFVTACVLESLCPDLYVERFFWGIHIYMHSEVIIRREKMVGDVVLRHKQLRRMMINKSLADCRFSIFLFLLLTIQSPFNCLIYFKWFRHSYNHVMHFFREVALFFNFLHH